MRPVLCWLVTVGSVTADYWWMGTGAFGGQAGPAEEPQQRLELAGSNPFLGQAAEPAFQEEPACPSGQSCLTSCPAPRRPARPYGGVQPRRAQALPCPGGVCCPAPPSVLPLPLPAPTARPAAPLPITECPTTMKCVNELFCDASGRMVAARVEVTPAQRRRRGALIPCMDAGTGQLAVCCTAPLEPEGRPALETALDALAESLVQQQAATLQQPEAGAPAQHSAPRLPAARLATCPRLAALPPLEQCRGQASDCWSPGVRDLDCLDAALCCFDGCANRCQGRGAVPGNGLEPLQEQDTRAPLLPVPASPLVRPRPQQQTKTKSQPSNPKPDRIVFPEPLQASQPLGYGVVASLPADGNQLVETIAYVPSPKLQSKTPPKLLASPQQKAQQVAQPGPPAVQEPEVSLPFTQCPSAMKCVERRFCDFNGVMREYETSLPRGQELLRVPLIPCTNRARGGAVDTCCRDPNYKDPWPESGAQGLDDGQYRGEGSRAVRFPDLDVRKSKATYA